MHCTTVVLKNGRTLKGRLVSFKPEEGWISIAGSEVEKVSLGDVVSAVTEDERFGEGDELRRARRVVAEGRKHGWWNPPVMDWE
jgi:hypothetical protein